MTSGSQHVISWGHTALTLVLAAADDGPVRIVRLDDGACAEQSGTESLAATGQPVVEVLAVGAGRDWSGSRLIETAIGARLRLVDHVETRDGVWLQLVVTLRDPLTGLTVEVFFRSVDGLPAIRTWARLIGRGSDPVVLQSVTSFACGAFLSDPGRIDDVDVHWGDSDWLAEGRWHIGPLRRTGLPDLDLGLHGKAPRGRLAFASHGSWSSGERMPTGALVENTSRRAWVWQVEHNGAWRWEVGERLDGLYLALLGPTEVDHQWLQVLDPGHEFITVPVGLAIGSDGLESGVAALTAYRRALVRPHPDHETLPVVFNDYMNTLMGEPTTDRLLPLVDASSRVGAEYFCIDAGWYADDDWWDSVGAWEPSATRFPRGLAEVVDRIRHAGMTPGLWLEPEVIGVNSPVADQLPDEAFFQRSGRREVENGRYHLDLRHPAARAHLDGVVDRLVRDFGIGYFKLDYNINPGPGTDVKAAAPGEGLLGHNRAYLAWLDRLLDRHPNVVLENCSSGAMRMDYAVLSRMQLQSTSDQRNFLLYPPIAAAAPLSVLPEQSASWAYPQPEMSLEEIAFTLCTAMLGRLYLSGHIDRLSDAQFDLVRSGIATHKAMRGDIAEAVPFWPLGLPSWTDGWICLGLRTDQASYVVVWQRPGASTRTSLSLPHLQARPTQPEVIFPTELTTWDLIWSPQHGRLDVVSHSDTPAARLIRLLE
jgi:alpha-galactosidase